MKIRQFISKFSCTIVDFSATLLHLKTTNLNFFCFLFGVIFLKCAFLFIYLQKWPTYKHLKKNRWLGSCTCWSIYPNPELVLFNCRWKTEFFYSAVLFYNAIKHWVNSSSFKVTYQPFGSQSKYTCTLYTDLTVIGIF